MTALTKAIIAAVISFFGSFTVDPEVNNDLFTEKDHKNIHFQSIYTHPVDCYFVLRNACI